MVQSILTQETFQKLRAFAAGANKQAPSHPYDEDRWREFVIGAHREDAQLAAQELRDWLIDQGFPEDITSDLVIAYERGRELLRHYETRIDP
jgi:hypothetical protein